MNENLEFRPQFIHKRRIACTIFTKFAAFMRIIRDRVFTARMQGGMKKSRFSTIISLYLANNAR